MADLTTNIGLIKDAETDYYSINTVNSNLDKIDKALGNTAKFERAGGTPVSLILSGIELIDGRSKTFVISANNNGVATTINGKQLYKPGTTTAPKLIKDRAVTVWYDEVKGCFFIKASAEGTALAEHVLAPYPFSNENDTGIEGTMPNNGPDVAEVIELTQDGAEYTVARGFHSGLRIIKAKISGLIASVIKAGATVGGITGTFTSDATAITGDILLGKKAGVNGTMVTGSMPNRGNVGIQNLTSEGAEYTIPEGYHNGLGKVKAIISGLVASVIKAGAIVGGITGTFTSDATAAAGDILDGKKAGVNGSMITGTMANRGAVSQALAINGSYTIPAGYHNGAGKVTQAITTKGAQTYIPGTADQTIASGQYLSGAQTIKGDANLVPSKIPEDTIMFGIQGTRSLGKKFVSGTTVTSNTGVTLSFKYKNGSARTDYYLTVSGLTFKPSFIILKGTNGSDEIVMIYTSDRGNGLSAEELVVTNARLDHSSVYYNTTYIFDPTASAAYVTASGFRFPCSYPGVTLTWWAFE